MNFFAQQAKARTNTSRLVLLFALAVISLILITLLFLVLLLSSYTHHSLHYELQNSRLIVNISVVVIGVVSIAWFYKSLQLASGGKAIAEAINATLITHETQDLHEKKILNVVEEMAIASGIPVPPVYVFEEDGINAFAAGYAIKDAVVVLSRGCIANLNRDELQGVIAHEFSHIFNGDMRLNIRLISTLYGILVIGLVGQFLMRSASMSGYSSRNSRGVGGLLVAGLGLVVIGYTGTFFGQLIKAAVSRQREFLADATAVQYTRQADGIANALKKIGGYPLGSYVNDPEAHEISHLFFNQAINIQFSGWMATHPPLEERIHRVDPHWDGHFIKVDVPEEERINPELLHRNRNDSSFVTTAPSEPLSPIEFFAAAAPLAAIASPIAESTSGAWTAPDAAAAVTVLQHVGTVTPEHVAEAQTLLQDIPEPLKQLARSSDDVQALIYCLLLDKQRPDILEQQLRQLDRKLSVDQYSRVLQIKDKVSTLPIRQRLPLINIAVNTLRQLDKAQYAEFKDNLIDLIQADKVVDLFEWSLYRLFEHNLNSKPSQAIGAQSLASLQNECQRLLSAIALTGSEHPESAAACFQRAWQLLELPATMLLNDCLSQTSLLDQSLMRLNQLHPLKKPLFIKACCAALPTDDDPEGIELIFTIVNSLDVPMPPLLANQKIC